MAGPVGRAASAETDALMHAKILSYSRSRGVFAGAVIEGATLRPDDDDNRALYGKKATHQQILDGRIEPPQSAQSLISMLGRYSRREQ
jgi:lipid-binding SYLF domain-containing protein